MPQTATSKAGAAKNTERTQGDCFPTDFSWLRHLSEEGRVQFLGEFGAAVGAQDWAALSQLLAEWQGVAEIHSDPELFAELTNHVGDSFELVPRP